MSNPQMKQFETRLRRIDKIHRRGGGFEAAGTLGQSYYTKAAERAKRRVIRPMLTMVVTVLAAKSLLIATMGPDEYKSRVQGLTAGSSVEQAGAFLMAADPLSLAAAKTLGPLLGR